MFLSEYNRSANVCDLRHTLQEYIGCWTGFWADVPFLTRRQNSNDAITRLA
jgi:hypothetical protein